MKKLIFITLKILEIATVAIPLTILAIIVVIIDYLIFNEFLSGLIIRIPFNTIIYSIILIASLFWSTMIFWGGFDNWIKSNKKLTDKIYKKLFK